jgi:hypothetical protein
MSRTLVRAGLVSSRQEGRFIFYAAGFAAMDDLIAFLTDNCCQGGQCLPKTAAAATTAKRRRQAANSGVLHDLQGTRAVHRQFRALHPRRDAVQSPRPGPHRGAFGRQQARRRGQSGRAGNAGEAWRALRRCAQQILGRIQRRTAGKGIPFPTFDFIFTVCGNAAQETCPVWPGHPATAHWGIPDPAHVEPLEARREAFEVAYQSLKKRIEAFLALPLETMSRDESALAARRIHDRSLIHVRAM